MRLVRLISTATIVFVAAVAVLVAAAYLALRAWERSWHEGQIPRALEIDEVVLIDGESGLREGCGAAVFRLSSRTLDKIRRLGAAAFEESRQARSSDKDYFTYSKWEETPYRMTGDGLTLTDRWLNGLGCAKLPPELGRRIHEALESKGSFFSTTQEGGLIIIPGENLAVLSYEG